MNPDVAVERAGLAELFAAHRTFEWFFSGVYLLVVRKRTQLAELFVTKVAVEGFFTCRKQKQNTKCNVLVLLVDRSCAFSFLSRNTYRYEFSYGSRVSSFDGTPSCRSCTCTVFRPCVSSCGWSVCSAGETICCIRCTRTVSSSWKFSYHHFPPPAVTSGRLSVVATSDAKRAPQRSCSRPVWRMIRETVRSKTSGAKTSARAIATGSGT